MKPTGLRRSWLPWALALAAFVLFAGLGRWQLGRAEQKRVMLAHAAAALNDRAPQPLAAIDDVARAGTYDWMRVDGRFLASPAVLLDNQSHDGAAGVRAYRAFETDDGRVLLVDLGWTALPGDRKLPQVPEYPTRTTLTGLLLPPPARGVLVAPPVAQPDGTLLATMIDATQLRAALRLNRLAPRVLRPQPERGFGFERDYDILPNTLPPERHIGYAVQWFALAATVLITTVLLTLRRARRTTGDAP